MAERWDSEDFFREIDPDLNQYKYAFSKSDFTSSIAMNIGRSKSSEFQSLNPRYATGRSDRP